MRRFATLQAVLTAWLVLALSGCFLWFQPHPVATRTVSEPMIRSGPALAPIVGRISPEPATGTLRLTIHWPMGPGRDLRGYHAQLIPDSTSRIAISIQDGDTEVATASISREAGQASAGAVFKLEAAANLAVLAEAYSVVPEQLEVVQYRIQEESNPGEVLIAQGSAIVNVNKSQDTDAAIELSSLYVPAVSELSSNAARPGDLVRLSGSNLQVDWNPGGSTVIVRTVSGTASAIVSASPEAIDLTVPDGAVTGPLNVIVDGVPSPSDATLWISDDLRVNAPRAEWDTSAQDARVVLFDHVITIGATYSFRFAPQEGPSAFEEPPRPRWSARNGGTGTLSEITSDETTFVAATREGKLVAEARLGVRNTATLQLLSRAVGPFANANLNLPQTRRSGGITLGDRLYVIGDQDKRTSVFSAINPQGVLQGWVSANRDLTQARLTRPVSIGRYVYVFGGYSEDEDDILDTVERAAVDG
ncbi:MAG: hypothetical protein FJZ00_10510, partial [Candidatus Sericytochromatia bacterium]|nr:hypothetical protein [Candidatus Tanganyikabacteria bacterium]